MCIAIYKPAGKMIDTQILSQCWGNNPDGAGFVFPKDNGELELLKGFMKWKDFKKAWKSRRAALLKKPVVIHFRVATHGAVSPINTHPFWVVPGRCAVAHNGVLSGTGAVCGQSDKTDTEMFTEKYLAPLYEELPTCFKSNTLMQMLGRACSGSKLAVMQEKGEVALINEQEGLWEDGIWYSNGGYKHRPIVLYTNGRGGFHNSSWRSGGYYDSRDEEWERAWRWRDDNLEMDKGVLTPRKSEIPDADLFWCMECDTFFTGAHVLGFEIEEAKCPQCGDWVYHEDSVYYCARCKQYSLFEDCDLCDKPTISVSELVIGEETKTSNEKEEVDDIQNC
jgi:predicted RNA-binding Zn-ribbon protein involved in translation (DUF1610 family)